jgi:senataxin
VFSENGNYTKYSRSLFERFLECGIPSFMLTVQYRMLPQIREFPSDHFYGGRLVDDASVTAREISKDQIALRKDLNCQPVMFFDLAYSKEQDFHRSKQNIDEANFVCNLLRIFLPTYSSLYGRIGVITPYKSQKILIKRMLAEIRLELKLPAADTSIEVNTVDAYQGREKDLIIMSTVRSDGIGFLSDYRRMNVAITRAKNFLILVGNEKCLQRNNSWSQFTRSIGQKYTFKNQVSTETLTRTL